MLQDCKGITVIKQYFLNIENINNVSCFEEDDILFIQQSVSNLNPIIIQRGNDTKVVYAINSSYFSNSIRSYRFEHISGYKIIN